MSSTSGHQQFLSPTNMAMLERVLTKVRARNSMSVLSKEAKRSAARFLIQEFQSGVDKEDGLVAALVERGVGRPTGRLSAPNETTARGLCQKKLA